MKNKYKTIPLLGLCVMLVPLFGYARNSAWDKALDRTVAAKTAQVEVQVKFIKPIHMSDVMYRPPRGKDVVIDEKHKEKRCVGTLSLQLSRVYVPTACVQEGAYHISQVNLTFANGQKIQTTLKNVQIRKDVAFVTFALK